LYYPDYYYAANDKTEWYFTKEGIANGLRLPLNKLSLIRDSGGPASTRTEGGAPKESTTSESASATETPMLPAPVVLLFIFVVYLLRR
jgi:peptide/nickel transport system substrate-binding protein